MYSSRPQYCNFIPILQGSSVEAFFTLFQMKPPRCTLLLSVFISTSLHVSGNYVPIITGTYWICVTLVFFTLNGWLSGLLYMFWATVCPSSEELTVSMRNWYLPLCMVGCLVFSTCFGQLCAHHQENLLHLCDTGIFHSVWLAVWPSLHVSGNYVPIIKRTVCIYATLVFFTLYGWLSGLPQGRQPPTQSEKYQCRIDTVSSPDDGNIVARNM